MPQYLDILFIFFTAFIIAFVSIPKVISLAEKLRLFAPKVKRASHKGKIPSLGGVAIFISILISLLCWTELTNTNYIILSLIIIFFVGVIDDLVSLSPTKKILGQIISIGIIIFFEELYIDNFHGVLGIHEIPYYAGVLFTLFVVVVITNAYNLIDGVDALAGSLGVVSSIAFGISAILMNQTEITLISFTLAGSLLGFIHYNKYPAKIFMGDTGSLVVGMVLSILAINLIKHGIVIQDLHYPKKGPFLSIVFLSIPLFDSLRVFISRVFRGKNPLYAARDHIHHALLDLNFGHKFTTLTLLFLSIIIIVISYFIIHININIAISLIACIMFIFLLTPFYILRKNKND